MSPLGDRRSDTVSLGATARRAGSGSGSGRGARRRPSRRGAEATRPISTVARRPSRRRRRRRRRPAGEQQRRRGRGAAWSPAHHPACPGGRASAGRSGPRSRPETCSARAMNSSMSALPWRCSVVQAAAAAASAPCRSSAAAPAAPSPRARRPRARRCASGVPGWPDGGFQNPSFEAGHPVEPVEDRLGAAAAVALGVVPLGPGREALVEPDVRPALQPDRVAEPLVRGLVDERRQVGDEGVDRAALGLQRVAEPGRVVDDRAGGVERVGAEEPRLEADHLRQRSPATSRESARQPRVDQGPGREAADRAACRACRGRCRAPRGRGSSGCLRRQ